MSDLDNSGAFYEDGSAGRFLPSEFTRGPWRADAQHGGPPTALTGRLVERNLGREDARVVRVTVDILRPVPITPLQAEVSLVRAGRSLLLHHVRLADERGDALHASVWSMRTTDLGVTVHHYGAPPEVQDGRPAPFFPVAWDTGFHTATEWRFVTGTWVDAGPAVAWMRLRVPLVAGEEPSPLQRVLVAGDCGNGVSSPLDFTRYVFVNTDLTVAVHRPPVGPWICLDARTTVEADGTGLAESVLSDAGGPVGRGLQNLFVDAR